MILGLSSARRGQFGSRLWLGLEWRQGRASGGFFQPASTRCVQVKFHRMQLWTVGQCTLIEERVTRLAFFLDQIVMSNFLSSFPLLQPIYFSPLCSPSNLSGMLKSASPCTSWANPADLRVKAAKYVTSLDSRGYIPVYEYDIPGGHTIMWDSETEEVHFTGIWKALGNSKADIVKIVDSNPELQVKKIRGGFLKIQGTWIKYEEARKLALRTCYHIRHELVPLFGTSFPTECDPSKPGYGCLLLSASSRGPMVSKRRRQKQRHSDDEQSKDMKRIDSGTAVSDVDEEFDEPSETPAKKHRAWEPSNEPRRGRRPKNLSLSRSPPLTPPFPRRYSALPSSPIKFRDMAENEYATGLPVSPPLTVRHGTSTSPATSPSPLSTTFPLKSLSRPVLTLVSKPAYPSAEEEVPADWVEMITATLLLQKLSQDDGKRPFKPWYETLLPRSVSLGEREFTVVWH
ncbi:uncharacterized protein VTP21DRAFT_3409 [Calcarisporiella thermophila]|uniref:uncharacterized protein n=1 Tax=Calcarisporiella thermophila TaxID=911321 RepID=UPI00374357E1